MSHWKKCSAIVAAITAGGLTATASAGTVTFDSPALGLNHGDIVSSPNPGKTIPAMTITVDSDENLGVIFDGRLEQPEDMDLQMRGGSDANAWDRGNIPETEDLGNMLIIQENDQGVSQRDRVADNPDDEGSRPAGAIHFTFDDPITGFGFDLVDVEGNSESGEVRFLMDGIELQSNTFAGLALGEDDVEFGNNSANRFSPPIQVDEPQNMAEFNEVVIDLGGSGAVDNIVTTRAVPSPTAAGGLVLLGGLLFSRRGLRRAKA